MTTSASSYRTIGGTFAPFDLAVGRACHVRHGANRAAELADRHFLMPVEPPCEIDVRRVVIEGVVHRKGGCAALQYRVELPFCEQLSVLHDLAAHPAEFAALRTVSGHVERPCVARIVETNGYKRVFTKDFAVPTVTYLPDGAVVRG